MPVRFDPGRRTALAVGIAVLIASIVTGAWVAAAKPRSIAVSATVPSLAATATPVGSAGPAPAAGSTAGGSAPVGSTAAPTAAPTAGSTAGPTATSAVVVDVAGRVRNPGLYQLAAGSRIDDALRAAGGALHGVDLSSLNLAARVVDGQQILVGRPGAAAVPQPGATPSISAAAGPVDLNTASLDQLQTLPGVGPVLAQHILDYRTEHGSFTSVTQLNDVSGIGDVKFAALRAAVSV